MNVQELEGAELDAAVARAGGRLVEADEPGWKPGDYARLRAEYGGRHVVRWYSASDPAEVGGWEPMENQGSPSTDWSVGGPIIERERIVLEYLGDTLGEWRAAVNPDGASEWSLTWQDGTSPLIAAMRAYVASKEPA